jgi:predicted aminopeptidase
VRDARLLASALGEFRREVASLYARELSADEKLRERTAMEARIRGQLPELLLDSADPEALGRIAQNLRLNDACLALRGTYTDDLERHGEVFAALGGDLAAMVARLRAAALTDDPRANFFADIADVEDVEDVEDDAAAESAARPPHALSERRGPTNSHNAS